MTLEQEKQFLEPFSACAQAGEITTTGELHRAFEECIEHRVDESMIYRLLQRHGWRKVIPRPRHPKAQEEAQETFKKTVGAILTPRREFVPNGFPGHADSSLAGDESGTHSVDHFECSDDVFEFHAMLDDEQS